MTLNAVQSDRAAGVLLGAACGDALGVPYEFSSPPPRGQAPRMSGGGLGDYAPGEYSDDTQMAICVAEVAATGADLRETAVLDRIASNFVRWRTEGATDVGIQTSRVIAEVRRHGEKGLGAAMREAGRALHEETGRSAGNGSLMRTGVVALAYLDDPVAMAEAARAVAELREEGHKVLLHCAAGQSRTPAVAARYAMLRTGKSGPAALAEMRDLLDGHGYYVNTELRQVVEAFDAG